MGAMIVLLILIARQTQLTSMTETAANEIPAAKNAVGKTLAELHLPGLEENSPADFPPILSEEEIQEKRNAVERERGRFAQLLLASEESELDLSQARQALQTAQAEVRREKENAGLLAETLSGVSRSVENPDEKRASRDLKMRIAEREVEIEKLEKKIRSAESNAKERGGSYVVVPYDGPGGTRRYPLYVECRKDGAFLMPENIRLTEDDFEGILSRSNPLQAALSEKREYLRESQTFYESPEGAQEPYPLILVRPEGILYLYMAREALQAWWKEFGYELVSEKIKIAYPPVDEGMKQRMERAVARARQFQREMVVSSPAISSLAGGSHSPGGGVMAFHPTSQGPVPMNVESGSRMERALRNAYRNPSSGGYSAAGSGGGASGGMAFGENTSSGGNSPGRFPENGTGFSGMPGENAGITLSGRGGGSGGSSGGALSGDLSEISLGGSSGNPSGGLSGDSGSPGGGFSGDLSEISLGGGSGNPSGGLSGGTGGDFMAGNGGMSGGSWPETGTFSAGNASAQAGGSSPSIFPDSSAETAGSGFSGKTAEDIRLEREFFTESQSYLAADTLSGGVSGNPGSPNRASETFSGQDVLGVRDARQNTGNAAFTDVAFSQTAGPASLAGYGGVNAPRTACADNSCPAENTGVPVTSPGNVPPGKNSLAPDKSSVNWALEEYRPYRASLSQLIRMECHGDYLLIAATQNSREVRIPYTTSYETMKNLVKEVGKSVESWGTAGPGMYWRPILRVRVAEDGGARFLEMNQMLEGSGLVIEEVK